MKQLYSFSILSHATMLCCGKKVCKPDFSFLVYQSLYCHANIRNLRKTSPPFSKRQNLSVLSMKTAFCPWKFPVITTDVDIIIHHPTSLNNPRHLVSLARTQFHQMSSTRTNIKTQTHKTNGYN